MLSCDSDLLVHLNNLNFVLFNNDWLLSVDGNSLLEMNSIIYLIFDKNRHLNVSSWRSKELNYIFNVQRFTFRFHHRNQSFVQIKIQAMLSFDSFEFQKKFLNKCFQIVNVIDLFAFIAHVNIFNSNHFNFMDDKLFKAFKRCSFDELR